MSVEQLTAEIAVRSLNLLRAVVEEKTALNSDGKGLCPFHDEKTASFNIFIAQSGRARFYCFGCGASGDVFNFLQKSEGLNFRAAMARLATLTNRLPSFSFSERSERPSPEINITSTSGPNCGGKCAVIDELIGLILSDLKALVSSPAAELIERNYQLQIELMSLRAFVLRKAQAGDDDARTLALGWLDTENFGDFLDPASSN